MLIRKVGVCERERDRERKMTDRTLATWHWLQEFLSLIGLESIMECVVEVVAELSMDCLQVAQHCSRSEDSEGPTLYLYPSCC